MKSEVANNDRSEELNRKQQQATASAHLNESHRGDSWRGCVSVTIVLYLFHDREEELK